MANDFFKVIFLGENFFRCVCLSWLSQNFDDFLTTDEPMTSDGNISTRGPFMDERVKGLPNQRGPYYSLRNDNISKMPHELFLWHSERAIAPEFVSLQPEHPIKT